MVQVQDTDNTIESTRIKEILDLRSDYVIKRSEVRQSIRTGSIDNASGAEILKAVLDSFLLDIRTVILQSEYASVWTNEQIATIELPQRKSEAAGHGSQPSKIITADEIPLSGLSDLLKVNATVDRQWRRLVTHYGRFDDTAGEVLVDEPVHTDVVSPSTFDAGFMRANDVLAELGLEMQLEDIDENEWQI
jgi:hypothetical protein